VAGRKKHSAEDIVRKLRRAEKLAATGKSGEQIAAELEVSSVALYKWRRGYGGMDVEAARDLNSRNREQIRHRLRPDAEPQTAHRDRATAGRPDRTARVP
jgi:transposase-like protein